MRVMAFGLSMAIVTGLITGMAPALRVTLDLRGVAGSGGGGAGKRGKYRASTHRRRGRARDSVADRRRTVSSQLQTLIAEDPGYRASRISCLAT